MQAPLIKVSLIQILSASIPLASNNLGCKKPEKPLNQVNIFDIFIDGETDAQLSQYLASRHEEIARPLAKNVFKVVTSKEFITFKEILSNIQVFNSCFIYEIKNSGIDKAYKNSSLVVQAYDNKDKKLMLM